MRFTEVISPDRTKDAPSLYQAFQGKEIPLVVVANEQRTILHALGKIPRSIFISMADAFVQVKVIWRDAQHCLVVFDADANLILRVE